MDRDELLARLRELRSFEDRHPEGRDGVQNPSTWHEEADRALIAYIGDEEIALAFLSLTRWYS